LVPNAGTKDGNPLLEEAIDRDDKGTPLAILQRDTAEVVRAHTFDALGFGHDLER
jgi:hypothetical protein